jgi:hypothetical protein
MEGRPSWRSVCTLRAESYSIRLAREEHYFVFSSLATIGAASEQTNFAATRGAVFLFLILYFCFRLLGFCVLPPFLKQLFVETSSVNNATRMLVHIGTSRYITNLQYPFRDRVSTYL